MRKPLRNRMARPLAHEIGIVWTIAGYGYACLMVANLALGSLGLIVEVGQFFELGPTTLQLFYVDAWPWFLASGLVMALFDAEAVRSDVELDDVLEP